jgi:hypothetical protein
LDVVKAGAGLGVAHQGFVTHTAAHTDDHGVVWVGGWAEGRLLPTDPSSKCNASYSHLQIMVFTTTRHTGQD